MDTYCKYVADLETVMCMSTVGSGGLSGLHAQRSERRERVLVARLRGLHAENFTHSDLVSPTAPNMRHATTTSEIRPCELNAI